MERFYDLEFERMANDCICLTQACGVDEPNVILAHREQVLHIARQLCGMKPETAALAQELERKLYVLDEMLADVVLDDGVRTEIMERCGSGFEILARLDHLLEFSTEFTGGIPSKQINARGSENATNPAKTQASPDAATSRQITTSHASSLLAGQQLGLEGVR